jgi:hypothetical protein
MQGMPMQGMQHPGMHHQGSFNAGVPMQMQHQGMMQQPAMGMPTSATVLQAAGYAPKPMHDPYCSDSFQQNGFGSFNGGSYTQGQHSYMQHQPMHGGASSFADPTGMSYASDAFSARGPMPGGGAPPVDTSQMIVDWRAATQQLLTDAGTGSNPRRGHHTSTRSSSFHRAVPCARTSGISAFGRSPEREEDGESVSDRRTAQVETGEPCALYTCAGPHCGRALPTGDTAGNQGSRGEGRKTFLWPLLRICATAHALHVCHLLWTASVTVRRRLACLNKDHRLSELQQPGSTRLYDGP